MDLLALVVNKWSQESQVMRSVSIYNMSPKEYMKGRSVTSREKLLLEMLSIIRKNPGIRPRELHEKLGLEHSWNLRSTLIKRGLVRKERDGAAVRYYPVK